MDNDNRPNPDELLKRISEEEKKEERSTGKLKIFLGFCAGVGKTYAMLEDARVAAKNGQDIVIGVVETHGRIETEALVDGLELVERKKINYNNLELKEMDIDAILERNPKIVLVDELAHTNVAGSRHTKRYQDVEEILKAGIDVFTTLNIQHVESQMDIVQEISSISIHETVPDSILELADEIRLIDITPEKLTERLSEGKIYIPDRAKTAMEKFFRKGNLLALRELSLRYTAKCVDEEIVTYKNNYAISAPWHVNSKLLVGFSASPTSERLLRITHRMASDMSAKWYAVYVESPQQVQVNQRATAQLEKNIRLAEELGAEVVSLTGSMIADTIIGFAREKNVTLIIAGLSHRSRFDEIVKGTVLNELTKKSGQINVLIVGGNENKSPLPKVFNFSKKDYKPYAISLAAVSLITIFGRVFMEHFLPMNTGMLLILPVVLASIFFGSRVGLFTALIAMGAFDFFLIHPYLTFEISDIKYLPTFVVFILISLIISWLAKGIRWQTEGARHRERFLMALNSFTREIMLAPDILKTAAENIKEAFECETVILIPDEEKQVQVKEKTEKANFEEKETAVAQWVFKNGSVAGKNTNTLSSSKWQFIPLKAEDTVYGVIGINLYDKTLSSEQQTLLSSFANIIAMYLKRG